MMRVLQLGPYPPPHGGVQTNLVSIRRFLLARGIPCPVINLTRFRSQNADEIYYPQTALQVLWLLFRLRCDILHMHIGGNLSTRLLLLGLACTMLPGRKTVLTFHSGGYPTSDAGKTAGPRTLRGFVLRRFDRVIGVNEELVRLFQRFGVPSSRIRLILPHSISPDQFAAMLPAEMARFVETHQPRIVTVSGLEPEYEVPLQIEVLGSIRERFPEAGLMIIGSGSLETEVRRHIERKPYADHIMLCGDVPHSVTLRAISESDLFLRTTQYDGDSISVREALHAKVPVIATDNGMRPPGTHLIPGPDPHSLQGAIERVLNNGFNGPASGDTGESNLEEVFDLYKELIDENNE